MSKKTFEELFTELQHKAAHGDPATSRTAELVGLQRVGLDVGAGRPDGEVLAGGAQGRLGGFEALGYVVGRPFLLALPRRDPRARDAPPMI